MVPKTAWGTDVQQVNDNRNVAELNGNESNRNLNLNRWDEDWDQDYRFAAVRNSILEKAASANRRAFSRSRRRELTVGYILYLLEP